MTRRELLLAGSATATAVALASVGAGDEHVPRASIPKTDDVLSSAAPADPRFRTRPDLRIPALSVATRSSGLGDGLIMLAPYNAPPGQQAGAIIVDNTGQPVWEHPLAGLVTTNVQVQEYRGRPALTWWQGVVRNGHGVGVYVIAGEDYAPIRRVQAGNGLHADLHEFLLTKRGTALVTAYASRAYDLTPVGGSAEGTIQDAIVQEIDLASGRVLLEWHSLAHIPIEESYWPVGELWDYVHINSIAVDDDDNLLISSRNTHTVYKIDRRSGAVIWRLGGKQSDFAIGSGAAFAWQHDARRQADGTLTLFDNEGTPGGAPQSRAVVLTIDEQARSVALAQQYLHPSPLQASSQGSVQLLPNGNIFVGWGAEPYVSEFSHDGRLLFDAQLGTDYVSYRAFRLPWHGLGIGAPRVAARRRGRQIDVWASWNGDTRTRFWVVLAGPRSDSLAPAGLLASNGLETALTLKSGRDVRSVAVRSVDAAGRTLGQSPTISV